MGFGVGGREKVFFKHLPVNETLFLPCSPMPATDLTTQAEQPIQDKASNSQYKTLDLSGTWWSRQLNALNFATGRLSPEDGQRYMQWEEIRRWGTSLKYCEKRRQYLLKYSIFLTHVCRSKTGLRLANKGVGPIIRFMTEKVDGLGANITPAHFPCNFCVEMKAGGFNPDYGLELCANKMNSRRHQEQVMAHGIRLSMVQKAPDESTNGGRAHACI